MQTLGFSQTGFPDVLGHQGSHTGNGGSCHGGTGHQLVLVGTAAVAGSLTEQGVDVAAGGGDFGLQAQIAGNTPGAELAHGVVFGVCQITGFLADNGDLTGVVGGTATGGLHSGRTTDGIGISLGNGGAGVGVAVAGQVHAEQAGLVVVDDGGCSAQIHGGLGLDGEVGHTAGAEDHLAVQIHALVVGCIAQTVYEDVFIGGAAEIVGDVQLSQGGIGAVGAVLVAEGTVIDPEDQANTAVVFHGGNGEEAAVGAGGAHGIQSDVTGVGTAEHGGLGPGVGVTGGGNHHGVGLGHVFQEGCVLVVEGEVGHGGTQGQVHGVTAQVNGIFDGCHVVGVGGAAVSAEDLHGDQLGIGGDTGHHDGVQCIHIAAVLGDEAVGGGDTGNMGAVLALTVGLVVNHQVLIDVVGREGQLLAQIQLVGGDGGEELLEVQVGQNGCDLLGIQQIQGRDILFKAHTCGLGILLQSIQEGTAVQGLVIGVAAGIQNRDTGAGAGEAAGPYQGGAGHAQGCEHLGLSHSLFPLNDAGQIGIFQNHGLDACHLGNGIHGAVGNSGGDQVCGQGQIPDHIQLLSAQSLCGNGSGQGILLGLQLAAVGHGFCIAHDIAGAVASLNGGLVFQNNGNTDDIAGTVLFFDLCLSDPVGHIGLDFPIGLLPAEAGGGCLSAGHIEAGQQSCHQDQGKDSPESMIFHVHLSFK